MLYSNCIIAYKDLCLFICILISPTHGTIVCSMIGAFPGDTHLIFFNVSKIFLHCAFCPDFWYVIEVFLIW